MRLFANVRSYFIAVGIYSHHTNQAQPLNAKVLLISLFFVIVFMSTTAFVIFKATDIFEYAICFYFGITRPAAMAIHLTFFFQMPRIIKFIRNCEQFVKTSGWLLAKNAISNFKFQMINIQFSLVFCFLK